MYVHTYMYELVSIERIMTAPGNFLPAHGLGVHRTPLIYLFNLLDPERRSVVSRPHFLIFASHVIPPVSGSKVGDDNEPSGVGAGVLPAELLSRGVKISPGSERLLFFFDLLLPVPLLPFFRLSETCGCCSY